MLAHAYAFAGSAQPGVLICIQFRSRSMLDAQDATGVLGGVKWFVLGLIFVLMRDWAHVLLWCDLSGRYLRKITYGHELELNCFGILREEQLLM
ncbi:hypothetical protein Nepgr_033537 [Nepenthes gracilis]|uniref:Uncharacterized protein n=1 Tax=Nepenthes gracilis TaxID=150966 RepID=A0AAD3Y703_NEPGR|nr:hypothetical protein Nepgr_033537 [Nepenthes gracilis]